MSISRLNCWQQVLCLATIAVLEDVQIYVDINVAVAAPSITAWWVSLWEATRWILGILVRISVAVIARRGVVDDSNVVPESVAAVRSTEVDIASDAFAVALFDFADQILLTFKIELIEIVVESLNGAVDVTAIQFSCDLPCFLLQRVWSLVVSSVVSKNVARYPAQVNMNAKVKVFAHGWYSSNFVITEQQCLDILVDAKKKHKGKFTQIASVANGHLENFECVFLECSCIVISIWIISVELESYFELDHFRGTGKLFRRIFPLEPGDALYGTTDWALKPPAPIRLPGPQAGHSASALAS